MSNSIALARPRPVAPRPVAPRPAGAALPTLMIAATAVCFGLVPLFARELLAAGLSPEAVALWRYLLSLAIALPFFPRGRGKRRAALSLLAAGFAMGLGWVGYVRALDSAPVAVAGVVYMTYPLFVIPAGWLLARQPVRPRALLAGLLVLAAALLVLGPGGAAGGFAGERLWALLLCLPAPITFAVAIVVLTCMSGSLTPIERMAAAFTGTVVGLLPLALAADPATLLPDRADGWLWLAGIGVVTATLPQLLYSWAAPRVGAARTANAGAFELPTMLAVGWLAFDETLGAGDLVAAGLVLAAVWLAPAVAPQPPPGALPTMPARSPARPSFETLTPLAPQDEVFRAAEGNNRRRSEKHRGP